MQERTNIFSVELTSENIKGYDLIVLSTDHDNFDYKLIAGNAQLIVDTRNAFERNGIKGENVFKA